MKYRVIFAEDALDRVRDFLTYIAVDQGSPLIAERWWERALQAVLSLDEMPHRCPYAPENEFSKLTIRTLIVDRCLFLFHIEEETRAVRVIDFRHGSQQPRTNL